MTLTVGNPNKLNKTKKLHAELQRTNALLEELYPQLQALAAKALTASPADLPQIEAEATRLIDSINQQTAALQALREK